MIKNWSYTHYFTLALALVAAVMGCVPKAVPLSIVVLAVVIGIGYVRKEIRWRWYAPNCFAALLYFAYLAGIFFTENMELARGYAENKLSLVIFPLLLSIRLKKNMSLSPVLIGATAGLTLASFYGFVNAFGCYQSGGKLINCLTSVSISPIHHPTYFASFLMTVTIGVWSGYHKKEPAMSLRWIVPFTLLAALVFMLCLSLAALLSLGVFAAICMLWYVYLRWGKPLFYSLLVASPVLVVVFLNYIPVVKEEVAYTQQSMVSFVKSPLEFVRQKTGYKIGNEVRLVMWTVTVKEWMDHPLGVGTGNVDFHLSERLKSYGQLELASQDEKGSIRYNPHNQFLQTGLEVGVFGFALLLAWIIGALVIAHREKNLLFLSVGYVFILNCIFESMLQRQSGIVFFTFWIVLLTMFSGQSKAESKEEV